VENLTFPLYRPSFLFYLVCTPCTPMFMKPFVKTYLKKQQKQFVLDLKKALE